MVWSLRWWWRFLVFRFDRSDLASLDRTNKLFLLPFSLVLVRLVCLAEAKSFEPGLLLFRLFYPLLDLRSQANNATHFSDNDTLPDILDDDLANLFHDQPCCSLQELEIVPFFVSFSVKACGWLSKITRCSLRLTGPDTATRHGLADTNANFSISHHTTRLAAKHAYCSSRNITFSKCHIRAALCSSDGPTKHTLHIGSKSSPLKE